MTRVDFYILSLEQPAERDKFACKLAKQLFKQGRSLYLHAENEAAAQSLDQLLWAYQPQSFLPHGLLGSGDEEQIGIGWGDDPAQHQDVMINLALSVPSFIGRFERVAEVVVQAPEIRDPLRGSFKYYKDRGYEITTNEIQNP